MRIMAISAYVPQRDPSARQHQPRQTVTVVAPVPIAATPLTAAMLGGRGMMVDVIC